MAAALRRTRHTIPDATAPVEEEQMAVTADLAKVLDKAYEENSLTELVNAPVAALSGVSDGDAELLLKAFNIKTIGDLGRNKFFRTAAALVDLAERAK